MNIISEGKIHPNYCEASLFLLASMLSEFFSETMSSVELSASKVKATLRGNRTLTVYASGIDSFLSIFTHGLATDVYNIQKDVDGWVISSDKLQQRMLMRIE